MDNAKTCLVIDARKLEKLQLDGPALRIRLQSQSSRLFPLRRLARIHIFGALENGLDALLHCAEKQIPVAFFSTSGKLRCQLYFPVHENTHLSHWLDYMEFDPQVREEYSNWQHNQLLHVLAQLRCNSGAQDLRKQLFEEQLRAQCNDIIGHQKLTEAMDWITGIMMTHLTHILADHGLANHSRNKRKLLEDLAPMCELWLLYMLTQQVIKKRKLFISAQTMSDFYHLHSEALDYMVRRMIIQLMGIFESII